MGTVKVSSKLFSSLSAALYRNAGKIHFYQGFFYGAFTSIVPKNKKALGFLREPIAIVGGVGGIRTHARGKPSNDLATHAAQLHNPQMLFYFHIFNWFRYIVNKFHILHIFTEDKPYNSSA